MISIVNYGLGNMNSIVSGYKSLGIDYQIVEKASELKDATHLILPGVGSFDDAMNKINKNGFKEILNELVLEKKVYVLGICIGLQIMSKSSNEGALEGFGWLDIETINIDIKDNSYKVPHMGWNKIKMIKECPLLHGVYGEEFYFLHSFNLFDEFNTYTSSTSEYKSTIVASISYQNIFGTQFHPEKSHRQGLEVLQNFSQL
tara:strand:+ start:4005 stop:4610 length:606 start_codon:yes stop_codon:yes gene_type:complete